MKKNQSLKANDFVIWGVAGNIGSGKTTVTHYLVQNYGFQHLSYSSMLSDLFRATKGYDLQPSRQELQEFGCLLTNIIGHAGLTEILLREMKKKKIVLDGVRHHGSYEFLVKKYEEKFHLIYRDIPFNLRYHLHNEREGSVNIHLTDFQMINEHSSESGINELKKYAHFLVPYFKDISQLYRRIDEIVTKC